jgi:dimethylargininase
MFLERTPIHAGVAAQQHAAFVRALNDMGIETRILPGEPDLPDSVFIRDTAVVLDEIGVMARPGAAYRRAETAAVTQELAPLMSLSFIRAPGTLDGSDVLRCGRTIYVGLSVRTNAEGVAQLEQRVASFGYRVRAIPVQGVLHLDAACSQVTDDTLLVNRAWVDSAQLRSFALLDVPRSEPGAANTLRIGDTVLMAEGFPGTRELLEGRGISVQTVRISEFQKAEGGVNSLCLLVDGR